MKIIKYRKTSKGKYKLFLDNDSELSLYEDVILKFELLLKKEISPDEIIEIEQFNQECDVYYVALESINHRFKSIYDTKEFLLKKEYPIELIDLALNKLITQGYLNDRSFAKCYINNQIVTTNKGPHKIRRELGEHHVDFDIIDQELLVFDDNTQIEKINKVATRLYKSNRNKGGAVLKRKIIDDLIKLGYDSEIILKVIYYFDFSNNDDIAKREYEKLYRRLSKKYEGKTLEYKIKEKLYQKGLYYEE